MNLIGVDAFRAALRAKRRPEGGVFRVSAAVPKALDDGTRSIRFCFSDGSIDRMGDTIAAAGWDIADFTANPVALWAHDAGAPPIGRASDVGPEGDRLMGTIEFVDAETYAFGDTVYRLLIGNFLRAVSVGFLPIEYSFVENDPDRGWGIDFKRQQLLEISVCPVPANPNALAEARAKGIDTRPLAAWAERTLDDGGKVVVTKTELQRLRKAAKEPPMARRPGTRRRAEDEPADQPDDDADKGAGIATCGRKAADECGLKDPKECAIHGKAEDEPDDKPDDTDKRLRRLERKIDRLMQQRADDGDPDDGDAVPAEHHDAIRIAHKAIKTCKAYHKESAGHLAKAVGLLDDVVDALDGNGDSDPAPDDKSEDDPDDDKPDPEEKRRQQQRAAALRARLRPVA